MSSKRVVVTGVGVVSPIGIGAAAFWSALLAG
jgi:3-oxoacyl-(acyl-carrier-protein) synthase